MSLPPRGTGRYTGRAGERRWGYPRTDAERYERHYGTTQSLADNSWLWVLVGTGVVIGAIYLLARR